VTRKWVSCHYCITTVDHLISKIFLKALAEVPLTARLLSQADAKDDKINISENYPKIIEYVKVRQLSGFSDFHAMPTVNLAAAGVNVRLAGVGKDEHRVLDDQPKMISLSSIRLPLAGQPRCLQWYELGNQLQGSSLTHDNRTFEDPHGIFYPKTTKVLVIAAKNISGKEKSFPFQLRLEGTMRVDIHNPPVINPIASFMGKPEKDDCWCFNIRAPYKVGVAKDALEDGDQQKDTICRWFACCCNAMDRCKVSVQ
jgi:hypothetical protein